MDSTALERELDEVLEAVMDQSTRGRGRQRAQEIYDNTKNPVTVRASAASIAAQAFFDEENTNAACRWIANAVKLAPSNTYYTGIQQRFACL